ncbi:MAG: YibE/F family protein [Planctomycetaceae bacterium]|nr:YibE/F family protein [Planctomycetaceae bacterium]
MTEILKRLGAFFVYGASRKDVYFSLIIIAACVFLWFLPTGFENRMPLDSIKCYGVVVSTDNSMAMQHGLIRTGGQIVEVELKDGPLKGEIVTSHNNFIGKLELDTFFEVGDEAYMNISLEAGRVVWANAVDHYRLRAEFYLLGAFVLFLILYAGFTGCQAVLSFAFTFLCMWKVLIPTLLRDYDPIVVTFAITSVLTFVVIFLVAGFNRKGLVAFLGAVIGLAVTCVLGLAFAGPMHINGAVRPFSETLLFAGFGSVDLTRIFLAGVFLSASGAAMDLAIDISAAMREVVVHHPTVTRLALLKSGIMVGRAVIGSMTTTLVLAYSGSYLTMMMLFMGQGVPTFNILNLVYVSTEILHTLAGSFGLVLVAPLTAIIGCFLYVKGEKTAVIQEISMTDPHRVREEPEQEKTVPPAKQQPADRQDNETISADPHRVGEPPAPPDSAPKPKN